MAFKRRLDNFMDEVRSIKSIHDGWMTSPCPDDLSLNKYQLLGGEQHYETDIAFSPCLYVCPEWTRKLDQMDSLWF